MIHTHYMPEDPAATLKKSFALHPRRWPERWLPRVLEDEDEIQGRMVRIARIMDPLGVVPGEDLGPDIPTFREPVHNHVCQYPRRKPVRLRNFLRELKS